MVNPYFHFIGWAAAGESGQLSVIKTFPKGGMQAAFYGDIARLMVRIHLSRGGKHTTQTKGGDGGDFIAVSVEGSRMNGNNLSADIKI
ncbi:MAG: hypothetical protein COB33_008125 [Thiotrichaceae bacterium]|nr:hypothetical protein [Thiotrichaceae bacterium]